MSLKTLEINGDGMVNLLTGTGAPIAEACFEGTTNAKGESVWTGRIGHHDFLVFLAVNDLYVDGDRLLGQEDDYLYGRIS